jgi:hypothetical protein
MNEMIRDVTVYDPRGIVQPAHLGQMFLDPVTTVFYQARGLTPADWHLVTPPELPGSFVKIFDWFLGTPDTDPERSAAIERFNDSEMVRKTMEMDGVAVLQAFSWRTALGANVAMTRLRFDRTKDISLFFGFDDGAMPALMPTGFGFLVEDGRLSFGGGGTCEVRRGATVRLRIETRMTVATAYLDDAPFAEMPTTVLRARAVVALFRRDAGARETAPGYEVALKHNLERRL